MTLKNLHRIGFISSNAARQILVATIGVVIPFLVIQHSSKEIWGEFVSLLLYSLFATQIINWGNKEYLLRKFSETPSAMRVDFSSILLTRFPLGILFSMVGVFLFGIEFGSYLFIWIFGRFLIHSYEVLVVYEKKFNASLVLEIVSFVVFAIAISSQSLHLNTKQLLVMYSLYQLLKGIGYLLNYIVDSKLNILKKSEAKIGDSNFYSGVGYSDEIGDSLIIYYDQYEYMGNEKKVNAEIKFDMRLMEFGLPKLLGDVFHFNDSS